MLAQAARLRGARGRAATEKSKAKGDSMMSASLQSSSLYKNVKARGDLLTNLIKLAYLQHECGIHWGQIRTHHYKRKPAPVETIDKLDAAVAKLQKNAPANFSHGDKKKAYWAGEASKMRKDNVRYAEQAKKDAEVQAAREAQKKADRAERLLEISGNKIKEILQRRGTPLPEGELKKFDEAVALMKEGDPKVAPYYERLRNEYNLYNAILSQDTAAVGKLTKSTVVSNGMTKGNSIKIPVKVKPGHCSAIIAAWKNYGGKERMETPIFTGDLQKMQMFKIAASGWKRMEQNFYGACSPKGGKFTMTSNLEFSGKKNGLTYTIVEWSKDAYPIEVALRTRVNVLDRCDSVVWESLWMNPIPGTLLWNEQEPLLLNDGWAARMTEIKTHDLATKKKNVKVKVASAQAPASRSVSASLVDLQCPSRNPTSKETASFNKCHNKIEGKYAAFRAKWMQKRDQAKRGRAWLRAKSEITKSYERERKEFARSCGKKLAKIEKKVKSVFDKLVDHFQANGVNSKLDVPARMKLERGK